MKKRNSRLKSLVLLVLHVFTAILLSYTFIKALPVFPFYQYPAAFIIDSYVETINEAEAILAVYSPVVQLDYNKLSGFLDYQASVCKFFKDETYCADYTAFSFNTYYIFVSINAP